MSAAPSAPTQVAVSPAPLDADERLHALDILRGLALFGMILVHFHQKMRLEVTGLEDLIGWGVYVLVEQKAWGTFAFLFGVGFAVLLRRLEARHAPVLPIYIRRLATLACFGVVAEVGFGFRILFSYACWGVPCSSSGAGRAGLGGPDDARPKPHGRRHTARSEGGAGAEELSRGGTDKMDTDVLVVGAGPTGLMLANQLARRGVRALIVDRHPGPALETRALGVQARTLEIYAHLGIVERALELGKRATGANMWARGRLAARVPVGDIGQGVSPYPFLLILGQDDNERLLGEALRDQGMTVSWNTELVGLAQEPDRVIARLKQPDGTIRELSATWVAGCDGARSAVRELNGIAFMGAPYEHVFFVADTRMTGPMVPDELNVYLWREGFHLFFPMRGTDHWRVVGIVPPAMRGREDLTLDALMPSIRQEAGSGLSLLDCSWFSTYRIHHRRAERFRDRRCFLLGDAAHIHSPVGAQGMNTGLQDAYNLGWKLALVISGAARETLLASYEIERIPVAQRLLATTDRAFSLIVSDSGLAGLFRTRFAPTILALALRLERVRRIAFRTISQTGIAYPNSPLSETLPGLPAGAPRAGDRFPWLRLAFSADGPAEDLFARIDDTRFTLLVIGQPAPPDGVAGLGDLLRTLVVPESPANDRELERARIPRPAFYLLRPDGHVGLAGGRLEAAAVGRYISERI